MAPKRKAAKDRSKENKRFKAPFKTPCQPKRDQCSGAAKDDFECLAITPVITPQVSASFHIEADRPGGTIKSPTSQIKLTLESHFGTPTQSCKSDEFQTPISEDVQTNKDFDSLGKTPHDKLEEILRDAPQKTPASVAKREFDSLGETPTTDVIIKQEMVSEIEVASFLEVAESTKGSLESCSGKTKRRRTQTSFYGDVKSSNEIEISHVKRSVALANERDIKKEITVSEASHASIEKEGGARKAKRVTGVSVSSGTQRRRTNVERCTESWTMHDGVPLDVDQVYYHPNLAKNRCWGSDERRAWVKPPPLPIRIHANYTENQIQEARHFSPGPPVCPWLIMQACHGRYPPDEMCVRIGMQMRRSWPLHYNKTRRSLQRRFCKLAELLRAFRVKFLTRNKEMDEFIFETLYCLLENVKVLTVQQVLDNVESLSEIFVAQHWFPEAKEIVMKYIRYIAEHILNELDAVKFTPFFQQKFSRLNIPWTGKNLTERGVTPARTVCPGSGPPFLTDNEFRKKFRCDPPTRCDEELTRIYDGEGNVVGHSLVPNLRELLTPILYEDMENIEKEETPRRLRLAEISKGLESHETKEEIYELMFDQVAEAALNPENKPPHILSLVSKLEALVPQTPSEL